MGWAVSDGLDPLLDFDDEPQSDDEDLPEARGDDGSTAPEPHFATLTQFADWLLEMYARQADSPQRSWCPEWWRHAEVIVRMDAMWRSFEQLRQEAGTGLSVWLRDHVDHHMAIILSDDGPLARCKPDKHSDRPIGGLAWTRPEVDPFDRDEHGLPPEPGPSPASSPTPAHRGGGPAPAPAPAAARSVQR